MDRDAFNQILRTDFRAFARKAFEILNPGTVFQEAWHVDAIAYVLEEMAAGRRRRQIINMPPRTLKSQICSVAWPAFLLGQNSAARIIVVSYAESLAAQLSQDTRRLMQSELYQTLFPDTALERQASLNLTTTKGGTRFATTVGGSLTGLGGDWIIIDDPLNATDAYSEPAREGANRFYQQTLLSRLNNPTQGKILLVMQRLHQYDLTGHLLEKGGFAHLNLQAEAEADDAVPIGQGLLKPVRRGDLLLPTRLTRESLAEQRRAMGETLFLAQYQQTPVPAEGAMIKRAWLCHADPPPRTSGRVTLSLDTATKTDPKNDYSVCTVWLEIGGKHYLIDLWRDRVDFPSLLRKVMDLFARHHADNLLIEDTGSGSALIQTLRAHGLPAIACKARDSKPARLAGVSNYLEAGLVLLPRSAPWLDVFVAELLGFPGARHDDQVDSLTQYLAWVRDDWSGRFDVFWT